MGSSVNRRLKMAARERAREAAASDAPEALPDIARLAGGIVVKSLKVLEKIIDDEGATAATRLRAIALLFDRVYGRPRPAAKPVQPQALQLVAANHISPEEWNARYARTPEGGPANGGG